LTITHNLGESLAEESLKAVAMRGYNTHMRVR